MLQFTKTEKKALRAIAELAHERELARGLSDLQKQFLRWQNAAIDAFELADKVRSFSDGLRRELSKRYDSEGSEFAAAAAVLDGIVKEEEAPEAARPFVQKIRESRESYRARSEQPPN